MRSTTLTSTRKAVLAVLVLVASLLGAVPAAAQTGGSGPPGSTTTTTPTTTAPAPSGSAQIQPSGKARPPANAPLAVRRAIKAANKIHTRPYVWGGGHGSFKSRGYDCSGAVSYVLHAAGLLRSPMVSGTLATHWGAPGVGQWITVYANGGHAWMVIAGLRYDTSSAGDSINQGSGPRWRYTMQSGAGYAARYYPGL